MMAMVSPGRGRGLFEAVQHASQRLNQGRVLIARRAAGIEISIALDDARRNADVLGIGAVVEQQVFAQVLQTAAAEEAFFARRGIGRHHALPDSKILDIVAHRDDIACQFVPEHGGRHDHPGVVPTPEYLDIGAAGQRNANLDQDVAIDRFWERHTGSTCKCSLPYSTAAIICVFTVSTSVAER